MHDDEPARSLDERLRAARERLRQLEEQVDQAADDEARPEDGQAAAAAPDGTGHVLFVPSPGGYVLVERGGSPPQPGETIAPFEDAPSYVVTKLAPSPLPGDVRRCAFLQEA